MFSHRIPSMCRPTQLLLIMIMFLGACTTGDTPAPESMDKPPSGDPSTSEITILKPEMMGFILDPQGDSVAYAFVGGQEFATDDGVVSGDFKASPSGWMTADKFGYATGYGMPWDELWGTRLFDIRLTPFQSMLFIQPGETGTLDGFLEDSFSLRAEISFDSLDSNPATVGLAAIHPWNVGPSLADFEDHTDMSLTHAFALQAMDSDQNPVNLLPGEQVQIQLTFETPPGAGAILGRFDPESGLWQAAGQDCNFGIVGVECSVETLGPLFGVFEPGLAAARLPVLPSSGHLAFSLGSLLARHTTTLFPLAPALQGANYDPAFQQAWANLASWMKSQEGSGGIDPNNPTLSNLLNQLANAARNYANNNRNESGKMHLLKAVSIAIAIGNQSLEDQLTSEAADLVDEMAEKALQESDCGEFRKLLKIAEQIELVPGSNMANHDLIEQKVAEMVVDCDVWEGTITVWMYTSSSHPAGLDMQAQKTPGWFERHDVKLWTNVKTHELHGTDQVQLDFPMITYVKEHDCRNDIKIMGAGNPVRLEYEGRYNGYEFQIIEPPGTIGSIEIIQMQHFEAKENETCNTINDSHFSAPNYVSVIVHGFEYGSPPITLQEMLAQASPGISGEITSFNGDDSLSNPDSDLGKYPFTTGHIQWRFTHTQPKLPIEE